MNRTSQDAAALTARRSQHKEQEAAQANPEQQQERQQQRGRTEIDRAGLGE